MHVVAKVKSLGLPKGLRFRKLPGYLEKGLQLPLITPCPRDQTLAQSALSGLSLNTN